MSGSGPQRAGVLQPKLQILEHPDATLYQGADKEKVLSQVVELASSGNYSTGNGEIREALRQTSLVSLWFWLKYVAGYSGPYDQLNGDLHVDMCNFYQDMMQQTGSKAAAFEPRFHLKSLVKEHRVFTLNQGIVPVDALDVGDKLIGIDENFQRVPVEVEGISISEEPVYRVEWVSGRVAKVADQHAFRTLLGWQTAEQLTEGTRTAIAGPKDAYQGTDEDYLVGVIYGDGGVTGGSVIVTNFDADVVEQVKRIWTNVGASKSGAYRLRGGMRWWKSLGLPCDKAIHKEVPARYIGNAAFLRGLFDTDGSVSTHARCVNFGTASRKLAEGVMLSLQAFGMFPSLCRHQTSSDHGEAFFVSLHGKRDLQQFAQKIGFVSKVKQGKLQQIVWESFSNSKYKDSLPPEWRELLRPGEQKLLKAQGIRIDNHYSTSYGKMEAVAQVVKRPEIDQLLRQQVRWDKVKSIEYVGQREVVHVQVSQPVRNFIDAQGIVHHNSTLFTHGANGWELLRNPDLVILLGSAVIDRAQEFLHITQRTFDSNDMVYWLFPEAYVVDARNQPGWNDSFMVMRNRTRYRPEPSLKPIAVGGSTQGLHGNLLKLDDIVGDKQLDSNRSANADMHRIGNWLKSSVRTLLMDWNQDRVFVCGTRYAPDDPYEYIMRNMAPGGKHGYWAELRDYEEREDGEWHVYYRMAKENGRIIFPDKVTEKGLEQLFKDDPWTYWTQMMNHPGATSNFELRNYELGQAWLDYDRFSNDYVISYDLRDQAGQFVKNVTWRARECVLVAGVDPAGSDRAVTAQTSRSALVVIAFCPDGHRVVLDVKADYTTIATMFGWMFDVYERLPVMVIGLETQGAFKILEGALMDEQQRRGKVLPVRSVKATGADKDARIRAEVQPLMERGLLYATDQAREVLNEEIDVFPSGAKKDVLDALTIGLKLGYVPQAPEAKAEQLEQELDRRRAVNRVTGY